MKVLNKSAPPVSLQQLKGLSYISQAKDVLVNISNENTKTSIIYKSLSSKEDRDHLKGVTCLKSMMEYLRQKYNRPDKIIACLLHKRY